MPLLGRISIASGHSVVPFVCPYFYRSFSLCLAFLLRFVWFATARNNIAPSRLYSILSSLISFPICVHAHKVRRETFPALFAHSLSRLHCCILLHLHHSLSSLSSPLVATLCAAWFYFIPICLSSAGCIRGLAPSVMLILLHVCGLNAHALFLTCAALCLLCLVSTFVY